MKNELSTPLIPTVKNRIPTLSCGILGVVVSLFLASSVHAAPKDIDWFTGANLGNVNLGINGTPPSYDADGLDIFMSDIFNQNPPRLNDTYSLSFMTSGGSAFVDVENKTYEAANPGANQNAQDLMSVKLHDVSIAPSVGDTGFTDLTFYADYGPNDLPADIKTYFGVNQAELSVSLDYDPANDNKINTLFVTLSPVPEPSPAILLGVGLACFAAHRRWLRSASTRPL